MSNLGAMLLKLIFPQEDIFSYIVASQSRARESNLRLDCARGHGGYDQHFE